MNTTTTGVRRRIRKEMRSLISLSFLLGVMMLIQFLWYYHPSGGRMKTMVVSVDNIVSSSSLPPTASSTSSPLSSLQQEQQRWTLSSMPAATSHRMLPNPLLAKEPLFFSSYTDDNHNKNNNNTNTNTNTVLLIGILSARENFDRRQTIRRLWKDEISAHRGIIDDVTTIPIRAVPIFLIGASYCPIPLSLRTYWFTCQSKQESSEASSSTTITNSKNNQKLYDKWRIEQERVTQRLVDEDERHQDLLFLNVSDYYHNSPFKVATFLAWAASIHHSSSNLNVQFIMKMDDDVYLDWRRLAPSLYDKIHTMDSTELSSSSRADAIRPPILWWWGYLRTNEIVHRNISDRFTARWSISKETWIPKTWPPFMSGGGNILHRTAAEYIAQNYDRFLHHDLFGEDIALGVWFSGTNIRYVHDDVLFPKNPRLANCTTNVILFVGQPALYNQCESEVHRRIALYSQTSTGTTANTTTGTTLG